MDFFAARSQPKSKFCERCGLNLVSGNIGDKSDPNFVEWICRTCYGQIFRNTQLEWLNWKDRYKVKENSPQDLYCKE